MSDPNPSHSNSVFDEPMTNETRNEIEGLLKNVFEGGEWGPKQKKDPVEREIAFQSEAMAEKLFAYLYADNPENAKKKWQDIGGKPPNPDMLQRAQSFMLEKNPQAVLPELKEEQTKILKLVKERLTDKVESNRIQEVKRLRMNILDSKQKQKDFQRKANAQIMQGEKEVDGLTILGAFYRGATRVSDDYLSSWREGRKCKEMTSLMKEMRDGIASGDKKQIFQSIREATVNKQTGAAFIALGAELAKAAARKMKDFIDRMTGDSRQQAAQNAPESVKKMLMLPPPQKLLPPPQMGGPELGQGMA